MPSWRIRIEPSSQTVPLGHEPCLEFGQYGQATEGNRLINDNGAVMDIILTAQTNSRIIDIKTFILACKATASSQSESSFGAISAALGDYASGV